MKTLDPIPETDPQRQLREIATAIETYRADLGMTKATLLRQYSELGTDKTYGKVISGDFAELKIEDKWLPAYQDVWSRIQSEEPDDASGLIADMHGPMELCRSYLETRNEKGNSRFILILGDSGIGKTTAIDILKAKPYGNLILVSEACEIWKNKYGKGTAAPLLREIGKSLGLRDLPASRDKLKDVIVETLNSKRRCLVIEEAHHLCPEGVNVLKTLINLTPVIIIATAMPILWDKLSGSRHAWAECKQLTGNRLAERIYLTLKLADVQRFLTARTSAHDIQLAPEVIKKCAERVAAEAVHYGNFKFVACVAKRFLREIRAGQDADVSTFTNAIAAEKKRR